MGLLAHRQSLGVFSAMEVVVTGSREDTSDSGWRDKIDRLSTWRTELTEEAMALPQTLSDLRRTITDLRAVSKRLEKATKGIEALLAHAESSGLAPLVRQIDAAATEVEKQVSAVSEKIPGAGLIAAPIDELRKTVDAFTSLLPKPPSKGDEA